MSDVLIELFTARTTGTDTGGWLGVNYDMPGDAIDGRRGLFVDLRIGTVRPIELVEDGQVDGLVPCEEPDSLWLEVPQ